MTLKHGWMGMAAAAVLLATSPGKALAKHGADDLTPEAPKPEKPEKVGLRLARHGADDVTPEAPKPEKPEKVGLRLARHGADDVTPQFPEPQKPETETPGLA